jgi:lipooligosaccharide transport system ATP-binding protein
VSFSVVSSSRISEAPAAQRVLAVSLRGVVKRYASALAVNGLDLEVPSGLCYGLLGPNGAGKSTTMRILTGQTPADAGRIEVLGYRLPAESKLARARMGVCPQESNLDVDLRVRDVLAVFARLYRVPAADRAQAVERALALAGLEARANDRAVTLSGGMQRRLLIARALIHQPDLVLLDEPTVGLDPQVRQELWSLVVSLREQGATVLMSTHYIEEAERLADRVAIMSAGRVVAEGLPADLVREFAGSEVVDVHGSAAELRALRERAQDDGVPVRQSGPALTYLRAEDGATDGRVPAGRRRSATLEDVFVRLTGDYVE